MIVDDVFDAMNGLTKGDGEVDETRVLVWTTDEEVFTVLELEVKVDVADKLEEMGILVEDSVDLSVVTSTAGNTATVLEL